MKKVIFVASTSYSGSTFLDMTLGNDPKGFSIGEVNALFEPYRPYHYFPVCGCYDDDCRLWHELREVPVSQLYQTLFDKYPEIDFIVDSSKEPIWINHRIKELIKQGIEYDIALIWKSPLEIAHSFSKRDAYEKWERSWVNYHRLLYSLQPDNWTTVSYHDYACNPNTLQSFCKNLGIPYFAGKEKFWEKDHHIAFGNHSARKHLQQSHRDNQTEEAMQDFQKIAYKPINDPELENKVICAIKNSPVIENIHKTLQGLSDGNCDNRQTTVGIKMSSLGIIARHTKHQLLILKGKLLEPNPGTIRSLLGKLLRIQKI